jgi:hypothetical protein
MSVVAFPSANVSPAASDEPRDLSGVLDMVQLAGWLVLTLAVFLVGV